MTATLPPVIVEALGAFHASLERRFGARVREVTLFGSVARGEATEESDVDVLVVIDDVDATERSAVYDLAYDAGARGDELVVVSPLVWTTTQAADIRARERRITREIARDGVPL